MSTSCPHRLRLARAPTCSRRSSRRWARTRSPWSSTSSTGDLPLPQISASAYQLAQRLATLKGVTGVRSYVSLEPNATLTSYQTLYSQPKSSLPAGAQTVLTTLTGSSIAVLDVANPYFVTSDQAHHLVRDIRAVDAVPGATVQVTGDTAFDIDLVNYMIDHTPLAIGFVLITTMIVLTVLPPFARAPVQGGAHECALAERRIRRAGMDLRPGPPVRIPRLHRRARSIRQYRCCSSVSCSDCRWTTRCSC